MTSLDHLIREGLASSSKRLPPVLFYDDEGSALFDEITRTSEYYLTRTERAIFDQHAGEILRCANGHGPLSIVELGAGSADKTRVLLRKLIEHQRRADYVAIDVSAGAIQAAAAAIEREIPGLRARPLVGDNAEMLRALPAKGAARLILFIGSSIGNFEPEDASRFLADLVTHMRSEDRILLGTDLVKDRAILDAAYNDAQGVTARFNLNALARLNRDYGADFDLSAFEHRAFYNADKRRIEMHLVSLREQRIRIPKLAIEIELRRGGSIHTENSYKYSLEDIEDLASEAGLLIERSWTDDAGWFGVHLLRPATS